MLFYKDRPLTLWAVAELVNVSLRNKDGPFQGMPRRKPGVMFAPLLGADFGMAARILFEKAEPVKSTFASELDMWTRSDDFCIDQVGPLDGFWTNRFMGPPNISGDQVPILDRVYDARTLYTTKANMPKYSADDLKAGDIVHIEMGVIRWTSRDEPLQADGTDGDVGVIPSHNNRYKDRRVWHSWAVGFKLDAISLLFLGPEYYSTQKDEDFSA